VGFFMHAEGIPVSPEVKEKLDALHRAKIAMSDGIYVVNVGHYVGESTAKEIALAKQLGKSIRWLETPEEGQCK
jgi:putative NIF3 family GTP cyclohydrolase 1 type 2